MNIFGGKIPSNVVENVTQKQYGFWGVFLCLLAPFWHHFATQKWSAVGVVNLQNGPLGSLGCLFGSFGCKLGAGMVKK